MFLLTKVKNHTMDQFAYYYNPIQIPPPSFEFNQRVRMFMLSYFKKKQMPHPEKQLSRWSDDEILDFAFRNFEFFYSSSYPQVILALPKCSMENRVIQSLMIPF